MHSNGSDIDVCFAEILANLFRTAKLPTQATHMKAIILAFDAYHDQDGNM